MAYLTFLYIQNIFADMDVASTLFISVEIIVILIYLVNILLLVLMLWMEREDPRDFMMWMVVILFIPLFGFICYLIFGQTYYARKVFSIKGLSDETLLKFAENEMSMLSDLEEEHPELKDQITFAKYIHNCGGKSFTSGNKVDLIIDGNEYFDKLFEDIRNAKEYIFAEYFIIKNDDMGNKFIDLLIEKVKEGVEVKVLTDALGSKDGPKKGFNNFRKAGGKIVLFHHPLNLLLNPKKNNRNHRKIVAIDGKVAYVGGYNVGDGYIGKGRFGDWRDTAVRIVGNGYMGCGLRFIADWNYASKDKIEDIAKYFDLAPTDGDVYMQIVSGGPDVSLDNPIKLQYEGLIQYAKERLYIHTPYLILDDTLTDMLRTASMRGVDVKIIIPEKPDHMLVEWNNRYSANQLMKHGTEVYMYQNGFMHSKAIVIDGKIASIGSANFDDRSLRLNFETNIQLYSDRICKELEDAFLKDLERSRPYSCEEYNNKTFYQKIKVILSRLLSSLA